MIKLYDNGTEFYEDNKEFLLQNKYTEVFFRFDSPLLTETNKNEYALKVYDEDHALVIFVKDPFNMLLYGDICLCDELVDYLIDNGYRIKDYLCPSELGDALMQAFRKRGFQANVLVGMDFMEAHEKTNAYSTLVEHATLDDLDELYQIAIAFLRDCGLKDTVEKEHIAARIDKYRIVRRDGKIVSMARMGESTAEDKKIAAVYTRDEYRGHGYARMVVGSLLNEIIDMGFYATLNVDQKNPISYHLYSSLGFKKVFSQGVYTLRKD